MEGFLSTSKNLDDALAFYHGDKNALLKINIKVDQLEEFNCGFSSIEHCSSRSSEKEVLFNPINMFKVLGC